MGGGGGYGEEGEHDHQRGLGFAGKQLADGRTLFGLQHTEGDPRCTWRCGCCCAVLMVGMFAHLTSLPPRSLAAHEW